MATKVQVVFDCADPARLSEFWARALHYKLQEPPNGFATWEEALKNFGVPEEEWNSASAIVDPDGEGPRVYFRQMETPKPAKNRVHMDLNVTAGSSVPIEERRRQVDTEVDRLLRLGATKQAEWEERGGHWVVMLDPEGNEFCVQ